MSQMIAVASRLAPRPPILTVSSQSCQQPRSNLAWTFLPLQLLRHTPTSALGTWNVLLQNRHVAGTWFLAQMSPFNEVFLATLHLKWSSVNTHAHARTHTYGLLENPAGHSLLQELSLTSPPVPRRAPLPAGLDSIYRVVTSPPAASRGQGGYPCLTFEESSGRIPLGEAGSQPRHPHLP